MSTCSGDHGREEEQEQADAVYEGHWSNHMNLWVKFYIEHSAADRVFDIVDKNILLLKELLDWNHFIIQLFYDNNAICIAY